MSNSRRTHCLFANMFLSHFSAVRVVRSQDQRQSIVENACPGPGACGGMYTANTMASAIEVTCESLFVVIVPFLSIMSAEF